MAEPMSLDQVKKAIALHGVTASKQAHIQGQRQDWPAVGRNNAIAAAAAGGHLLHPTVNEAAIPDLVEAAHEFGLLVPLEEVKLMSKEACIAAIRRHGVTAGIQQRAETHNGNHGAAQRLDRIAVAAERGRLLAAKPGDVSTPQLHEAAEFHGLIESDPEDSLSQE
jgi:4-aminobutyrate aminotransferase-like enzyme